jgi:hypothetical protein
MRTISPWAEHWTGEINAVFVSFLTMASNWLAPVPEAAMTGSAIVEIFALPVWLGYVVAASIEVAGFGVNAYYLEAQAFNDDEEAYKERHNRKTYRLPLENSEGARKMVLWFYIVTGCVVGFNAIYQVMLEAAKPIKLLAILFPVVSALATIAANKRAALHRKQLRTKAGAPVASIAKQVAPIETPTAQDDAQPTLVSTPLAQPGATTIDVWREICASANGGAPLMDKLRQGDVTNKADCVNEILQQRGFAPVSAPTARRYAKMAKGGGG